MKLLATEFYNMASLKAQSQIDLAHYLIRSWRWSWRTNNIVKIAISRQPLLPNAERKEFTLRKMAYCFENPPLLFAEGRLPFPAEVSTDPPETTTQY